MDVHVEDVVDRKEPEPDRGEEDRRAQERGERRNERPSPHGVDSNRLDSGGRRVAGPRDGSTRGGHALPAPNASRAGVGENSARTPGPPAGGSRGPPPARSSPGMSEGPAAGPLGPASGPATHP